MEFKTQMNKSSWVPVLMFVSIVLHFFCLLGCLLTKGSGGIAFKKNLTYICCKMNAGAQVLPAFEVDEAVQQI